MNSQITSPKNYISCLSHELKAPINVITGSCQIAGMYIDDKDKVCQCLKKINTASNHLTELINNIMTLAGLDSEESTESAKMDFDLRCLVDELIIMTQPVADQHQTSLRIDTSYVSHYNVTGHYCRLMQVLINTVSNGIKYSYPGSEVCLEIREKPKRSSVQEGEAQYIFMCKDRGRGMSREFLPRIYEPFIRSESALSSDIKGTGLGMFIVKRLVDSLNGNIQVSSVEEHGTTVTIAVDMSYGQA